MGQNFISCDRGQVLLLPPSLTDWLPEDHLVWSVLGAVEHMNLDRFYGAYRAIGELVVEVLALCAEAGLVALGEIAVDAPKCTPARRMAATAGTRRSCRRSSARPSRLTATRTSATGRPAGMSCLSSYAPARFVTRPEGRWG